MCTLLNVSFGVFRKSEVSAYVEASNTIRHQPRRRPIRSRGRWLLLLILRNYGPTNGLYYYCDSRRRLTVAAATHNIISASYFAVVLTDGMFNCRRLN